MIDIDDTRVGEKYNKIKSYLSYYDTYGAPLVEEYSKDLDDTLDAITEYLDRCRQFKLSYDVPTLSRIVMELSSTIYYTSSKLEQVEILADMAKISYKDKYNETYTTSQGAAKQTDRKYTVDQLKAIAEQESIEEGLVHFIYSHCADVIKAKISSANELLKGVSKVLSASMAEMQMTGLVDRKGLDNG